MKMEFGSINVKDIKKKKKKAEKAPSETMNQPKYLACSCKQAKGKTILPVANSHQASRDIHDSTAMPPSCCYHANTFVFL